MKNLGQSRRKRFFLFLVFGEAEIIAIVWTQIDVQSSGFLHNGLNLSHGSLSNLRL
jgi:hypothetical protein